MKRTIRLLSSLLIVFACNTCCSGGSTKNDAGLMNSKGISNIIKGEKPEIPKSISGANEKCSLILPEAIKKDVPEEMQYTVFLQLVLNLIKNEYVNELGEGEITEKTITGILSSLDPHSSYLNQKAFTALKNQTDGEFGGLGIEIMMDDGFVRIISPIDDTPAYKAGLKSGDLIIYIDDECISGISAEEALEKLRGKPKTKVKLKIKRAEKIPFDITLERDIIKIQSVKAEVLNKIGYIRISTFDKNTTSGVKKFIEKNQNLIGIVIDVRNNPGGLLDEAVSTSDLFLDGGKIVSTRGRVKENTKTFFASKKDITNGIPLVVLINSATASAPEIMAGALRDNGRAVTVGVRSFGKGSVQKVILLSEKSAIKLTVAKYYTPSGECIQANGITPDIEADYAVVEKLNTFVLREEFFNNALDADKKTVNKKKTDEENRTALEKLSNKAKDGKNDEEDRELLYRKLSLKERVEKDYQLSKAFDTIHAIHRFKTIGKACGKKVTN